MVFALAVGTTEMYIRRQHAWPQSHTPSMGVEPTSRIKYFKRTNVFKSEV